MKKPNWIKQISHNFNDAELDIIKKSALINSCMPIKIKEFIIVPSILGAPITIPKNIKQQILKYIKNDKSTN